MERSLISKNKPQHKQLNFQSHFSITRRKGIDSMDLSSTNVHTSIHTLLGGVPGVNDFANR